MTKDELISKMAELKRKGELAKEQLTRKDLPVMERNFYEAFLSSCRNWYATYRDQLKVLDSDTKQLEL